MSARSHLTTLIRFELRDEARAGEVRSVIVPFGAVALLTVPMAIGIESQLLSRIGPGIFWTVVFLFGILTTQRQSAVASPAMRDTLRLLGIDPAIRFAATALSSAALLLLFEVWIGAVTVILYDPAITGWGWLALILPLTALGLAMIGTIAGSVAAGLGGRSTLVPLLVAPAAIPILLGAAQATESLRVGAGILRWMLLLAIVDVIIAVAGVLTARPLEEPTS